jgi:hypothetical protein
MGLWDKIKEALFGSETPPETFYFSAKESDTPLALGPTQVHYDYEAEVENIRAEALKYHCVTDNPPVKPVADYSMSEDSTRTKAYLLWERDQHAGLSDRGDWYYWFLAK